MNDQEALQVLIQVHQLRLSPHYQAAIAHIMGGANVQQMARDKRSKDYAMVRFAIGTWESIATFVKDFSDAQRHRLFNCTPASLVWKLLYPAVREIRASGSELFAKDFEDLAKQYDTWTSTSAGQEFKSEDRQAVCAKFG